METSAVKRRSAWSMALPAGLACCAIAVAALAAPQPAAPNIIGGNVFPYSWSAGGRATGPASDLVAEMARRLGHGAREIDIYPWARTVLLGEIQPDTLIFPLSRTAAREDKYTWIVELLQDQYVLIAKADSGADISSLAAANQLKVGYLRGSPGAGLLAAAGNRRPLEAANSEELNARKLQLGRIDAWIANRQLAEQAWLKAGGKPGELRIGAKLLDLHMYLAADKHFPAAAVAEWRRVFNDMRNDGTLAAILGKYGHTRPPAAAAP